MDIKEADFAALVLFNSEASLVSNSLEIRSQNEEASSIIVQACLPFLSLIAYETSVWFERVTGTHLFDDFDVLLKKRLLFKYSDDDNVNIESFSSSCKSILEASRRFLKANTGVLKILNKDVGIFVLDDIEVGSSFTFYRYVYGDIFSEKMTISPVEFGKVAHDVGEMLGRHSACLVSVIQQLIPEWAPPHFSLPSVPSLAYDFHFKNIESSYERKLQGPVDNGLLFVLFDAYYSLGIAKVLFNHSIIDSMVFFKMSLLTMFHFSSTLKKMNCFFRSSESNNQIGESVLSLLSGIIKRKERKTIEKCKHLRDSLVHYSLPENRVLQLGSYDELCASVYSAWSSTTNMHWDELYCEIVEIAETVRCRLKSIVGLATFT